MATSPVGASTSTDGSTKADNPAVNLAKVLADENTEIEQLCANRGVAASLNSSQTGGPPARFAVAFSGGGIRSAAINLGVIQALAKAGILRQVHYCSAISGGGYILGWFTSWIRRSGFDEVEKQLKFGGHDYDGPFAWTSVLTWFLSKLAQVFVKTPINIPQFPAAPAAQRTSHGAAYLRYSEPDPIRHLRRYTCYLTPRMGLGSGDTLAMISIYLRNVLLNLTMIFSLLIGAIALFQLLCPWVIWKTRLPRSGQFILFGIAAVAAAVAGALVGTSLNRLANNQRQEKEWTKAGIHAAIATAILAACLWITLPSAWAWFTVPAPRGSQVHGLVSDILPALPPVAAGLVLVVISYIVGWSRDRSARKDKEANEDKLSAINPNALATLVAILTAVIALACGLIGMYEWLAHGGRRIYVGDWYVMLGLPTILVLCALTSYIDVGIAGSAFPDAKREWLGRLGGYYLYFAVIAAVIMVGTLRGPVWMHLLFRGAAASGSGGKWLKWVLPGGWVFTVLSSLWAAKSPKTGNPDDKQSGTLNLVAKIGPPVFLAGVFLLASWAVHSIAMCAGAPEYLTWVHDAQAQTTDVAQIREMHRDGHAPANYQGTVAKVEQKAVTIWEARGSCLTDQNCPAAGQKFNANMEQAQKEQPRRWNVVRVLLGIVLVASLIAVLLLLRLDANEFSMHLFYQNRLVRAFLGASNLKSITRRGRLPSPFTDFALDDDVPLQELSSHWRRDKECYGYGKELGYEPSGGASCYDGPYPVWGTALNLTAGEDLAWQRRKAASFIYSPLYCGWDYVSPDAQQSEEPDADERCEWAGRSAWAEPCRYAYRGTGSLTLEGKKRIFPYTGLGCGPSVGIAMAASGAAVSPNWGYHTSTAVAALLAIFNIRIGWWTGNPRRQHSWNKYAPSASYLIRKELMGKSDDASDFVYLSDGGHFENLGLYELVRRRIKYILACDAGQDPNYEFGDLATAVERCRRDFGVEIEIDPSPIRPKDPKDHASSQRHFAIGAIIYPAVVPGGGTPEKGTLLYVKSSLTGNEPADVLGQRANKSGFPHDPTANQFFNETQFEAYRTLGENMVAGILREFDEKGAHKKIPDQQMELAARVVDLFKYLQKQYAG